MTPLLLASQSAIRLTLLQNAGVSVTAHPARIDEDALRAALQAEDATPRDIADAFVYLGSDDAAWVTGVALPVDGGLLAGI